MPPPRQVPHGRSADAPRTTSHPGVSARALDERLDCKTPHSRQTRLIISSGWLARARAIRR